MKTNEFFLELITPLPTLTSVPEKVIKKIQKPNDVSNESETGCFKVPIECSSILPYKFTSNFLPTLLNIEIGSMNLSTHTCIEDSGNSLNKPFICFLKYPVNISTSKLSAYDRTNTANIDNFQTGYRLSKKGF